MRLDRLFRDVAAGGVVGGRWQLDPSPAGQAVASRCRVEGPFLCNPTSVVKSSVGEEIDVKRR